MKRLWFSGECVMYWLYFPGCWYGRCCVYYKWDCTTMLYATFLPNTIVQHTVWRCSLHSTAHSIILWYGHSDHPWYDMQWHRLPHRLTHIDTLNVDTAAWHIIRPYSFTCIAFHWRYNMVPYLQPHFFAIYTYTIHVPTILNVYLRCHIFY